MKIIPVIVYVNLMKQRCSIQVEKYRVVATNYVSIGIEVNVLENNKLSNQQLIHYLRSVS